MCSGYSSAYVTCSASSESSSGSATPDTHGARKESCVPPWSQCTSDEALGRMVTVEGKYVKLPFLPQCQGDIRWGGLAVQDEIAWW